MNTPYKMKGSPMQRNFGLPSPAKHEGFGEHVHKEGGSGSYEKNSDGSVGDQTGLGDTTPGGGTAGEAQAGNMIASFQKQQTQKSAQMANTPIDYDPHRREI
tara:strand:- start:786 stop:1091 length:306 start_codon:yes stop_codon:yes gene_type:complete